MKRQSIIKGKRSKKKVAEKNIIAEKKTHDLQCFTKTIADVFRKMSKEKNVIVDEMRFGALSYIPSLNVTHTLLNELANSFDLYENTLITWYGKITITPVKIKDALDLNAIGDAFP
ncbi:hypothetical protein AHAS_Ahas05G0038100 [Arachis hypogaea]